MQDAYTGTQIREAERPLLEAGEGPHLMARAAHGLFARIRELTEDARAADPAGEVRVVGLVGKGNNGGDTLFALAEAARSGLSTTAILAFSAAHPEALADFEAAGGDVVELREDTLERAVAVCESSEIVVDGVLGTGARGGLDGTIADLVRALRHEGEPQDSRAFTVLACDLPSGIDADSGEVTPPVLRADHTVTFGAHKLGLWVDPGAAHAGTVSVVDIGLDMRESAGYQAAVSVISADLAHAFDEPARTDNKYTYGVLELMAGSEKYPGAGILCTGAALATGVGMLCYNGPETVGKMVVQAHPETVLGPAKKSSHALVVGPGIDLDIAETRALAIEAIARARSIVLDAGAIELFSDVPEPQRINTILTPHAGELARLMSARSGQDVSAHEVMTRPLYWVRKAMELTGSAVLLKGFTTIVASPEAPWVAVQESATSRLATAGTGDVLAGIIGALSARDQPPSPLTRAALASRLHSDAAFIASANNRVTIGASDLIPAIRETILAANELASD